MTQAKLAAACGVNFSFISLLERGLSQASVETLSKIAQALHVSVDWILTGKESPETIAERAIDYLWPEIVYDIANHVLIPRLALGVRELPDAPGIQEAIKAAWQARTLCEFMAWAESPEGEGIGGLITGRRTVEKLISLAPLEPPVRPDTRPWTEYVSQKKACRAMGPSHTCALFWHDAALRPLDCPAMETKTIHGLHFFLTHGIVGWSWQGRNYWTTVLSPEFVKAAFPSIFWNASRKWSDRRMALWFWYLGLPLQTYSPLVRLARQYDSPETCEKAAVVLFDRVKHAEADRFLGLFPDIIGLAGPYMKRFGSQPLLVKPRQPGSAPEDPIAARDRLSRQWSPQEHLDYIFASDDRDREVRVAAMLVEETPELHLRADGSRELSKGRRRSRVKPRLTGNPPDTLP